MYEGIVKSCIILLMNNIPQVEAQKIWGTLRRAHGIDQSDRAQIDRVFRERVVFTGGLFQRGTPSLPNYLLGKSASCPGLKRYWKAILYEKDPRLLEEFRGELQNALDEAFCQKEHIDSRVYRACIYHVLSLFPFTYPEVGTVIRIDNQEYRVDQKLELTPRWFSSPIPAYGLVSESGDSLLAFIGSTYPAGEGCLATWLSDFTPCCSVGFVPSRSSQITRWLQGKQNVTVVGTSLGGALALHATRHPQVSRVFAFNAPGLFPCNYGNSQAEVTIFNQWGDLVSTMGYFPKNARIFRVIKEGKAENFVLAHARIYSGMAGAILFESTAHYENRRLVRNLLVVIHQIASQIICVLGVAIVCLRKTYQAITLSYIDLKGQADLFDAAADISLIALGAIFIAYYARLRPKVFLPIGLVFCFGGARAAFRFYSTEPIKRLAISSKPAFSAKRNES